MELTWCVLLLCVGAAIADPYGYGTKGGAAAKADAIAAAGAYSSAGALPINIPPGGYSGSFSKSSASSYSSSSASSSASSFSFSGSGGHQGAYAGGNGCGSGNCEGDSRGAKGLPGSGSYAFGAANAASAEGSYGGTNSGLADQSQNHNTGSLENCGYGGCQGKPKTSKELGSASTNDANASASSGNTLVSSDNTENCGISGKCSSKDVPNTGSSKCISGQCGPANSNKPGLHDDGSNDIHVPVVPSNPDSDCSKGNCGGNPANPPYQNQPNNYNNGPRPNFPNKPSIQLNTPKFEAGCSTPNCQNEPNRHPNGDVYSLPSYGTAYGSQPSAPACSPGTPGCGGPSKSPNYGSYGYPDHPSEPSCAPGSPGCNEPSDFKPYETSPFNVGPISGSACSPGTLGCGGSPPGYGESLNNKPSNSYGNLPYNAGPPSRPLCAPGTPGCGGSYNKPTSSYGNNPYNTVPSLACSPGTPGCEKPLLPSGYSDSPQIKPENSFESYNSNQPSNPICTPGTPGCGSQSVKPVDSYGNPAYSSDLPARPSCTPGAPGCGIGNKAVNSYGNSAYNSDLPSKPNCLPGTPECSGLPPFPGYGASPGTNSAGSYGNIPIHSARPFGVTCTPGSPSCGESPNPEYVSHNGVRTPNFSPEIPSCKPGALGCSTSGYGGSPNSKPNYDTIHSNSDIKPSKCGYGNCAIKPATAGGALVITPSFPYGSTSSDFPSKPSETSGIANTSPNSQPCPPGSPKCTYGPSVPNNQFASGASPSKLNEGAYGSQPTGSLQPPNVESNGNNFNKPLINTGSQNPLGPSSTYNKPSSEGCRFGTPGCNTASTFNQGSQKPTKDEHPTYTGGFGGPPGLLKPNEFTISPSAYNKPAEASPPITSPTSCTFGNCGQHASLSPGSGTSSGAIAGATASASANAVAYTGGFGGPPGFLTPFDNGKEAIPATDKKYQPSGDNVGNSGYTPYPYSAGSGTGANALASATAQAGAYGLSAGADNKHKGGSYGGYNQGSNGAGGCGGGCGSGDDKYNDRDNLSLNGNLGYSKNGGSHGSGYGFNSPGAVAKSIAGATSGGGGYGGSYASSSAHATSGAYVKGGYGRR